MRVTGLFGLLTLLFLICVPLRAENWKPIDQSQLAGMPAPIVEKDAPAEAIFWEVTIQDVVDESGLRAVWVNYIRIKVFTQLGVEQQSKVDIPYFAGTDIKDIAARTIKPNGQIVELQSSAINDRTIAKASNLKYKAKSFVLPGVEPGSIIEYRWTERHRDTISFQAHLDVQRDLPIQTVRYRVKPADLGIAGIVMKWHAFNMPLPQTSMDKEKYWVAVASNVPAFREESYMPPEQQVRQWLFLYYEDQKMNNGEQIWDETAKTLFKDGKNLMKFNDEVKRAAIAAAGDATTPEEKLRRLYDYCHTAIKRSTDDASGLTDEQLKKMKENKNAADVLKRRLGTGGDIRQLFAAMAASLGMDVRYARVNNRDDIFFREDFPHSSMLPNVLIAVKVDDKWRFFDPASTYIPADMLPWQNEGVTALVADPNKAIFITTPLSAPDRSAVKRDAQMKLLADGTLEGDVRVEFSGHNAAEEKEDFDDLSPAEQESSMKESLQARMGSNAEITSLKFANVTDPIAPMTYSYHVRIPGYAQRTGRRLLFQPGFFQKGVNPRFNTETRVHPIYFDYAFQEEQVVIIELPNGFELDNPDAPPPFVQGGFLKQDIEIAVSDDHRSIRYIRKTGFNSPLLLFKPAQYTPIKQIYDLYHSRDNHALSLRQASGGN